MWRINSNIQIFLIRIFIRLFVCIKVLIRIYSDIRSCQLFGYKYIRIFTRFNFWDTNIFGYSFIARFWYEYIRIFVCINFQDTNRFRWILYFVYGYFVDNNDQKCYLDCKSTELVPVQSRVWRIYSNIWIFLIRIFIWKFARIIFGYEYIRIFARVNFSDTNIRIFVHVNFSDTNIFGYSFVPIFRTQTDSDDVFI